MPHGKPKGTAFERDTCKKLSRWVTHGRREDVFWRSAISGGRATVALQKGRSVRQAGDICSVAPEGHVLTDAVYIECKHYRNLEIASFLLKNRGKLAKFWRDTQKHARQYKREPWLIAKQNNLPTMLITTARSGIVSIASFYNQDCEIHLFEDMLKCHFDIF